MVLGCTLVVLAATVGTMTVRGMKKEGLYGK